MDTWHKRYSADCLLEVTLTGESHCSFKTLGWLKMLWFFKRNEGRHENVILFIQVCIIVIYLYLQTKHLISDSDPGKTSPDSPQTPARLSKWIPSCHSGRPWSSSPAACRVKAPPPRGRKRGASPSAETASPAGRASAGGEAFPATARKSRTRGSDCTRMNWREKGRVAHEKNLTLLVF